MAANADALRARLAAWGGRVVATAAQQTVNGSTTDRRTIDAPHRPSTVPARQPARGRVTKVAGSRTAPRAEIRVDTFGWIWQPSGSARPFAPREHHANLAGARFHDWHDPRLANRTQLWLGVSHFWPGDHRGCRCQAPGSPAPPDMRVWNPVLREHFQRSIRAAAAATSL